MDNNKNHKTGMVIRFNGATYNLDEWTAHEEAAEKEHQLDWQGAFPDQAQGTRSADKLIPDSSKQNFPEKNRPGEMEHPVRTVSVKTGLKAISRRIRHYWLPGAAALVVGITIGLSLLNVLPGKNTAVNPAWPQNQAVSSVSSGTGVIRPSQLTQTFTVIQTGVFSTRQLADVAVAGLRQQGIAAVAAGKKPVSVLIGSSVSAQSADDLLKKYRVRNLPVYKKLVRIGPKNSQASLKSPIAGYALKANLFLSSLYQVSDQLLAGNRNGLQKVAGQVTDSRVALRQVNATEQKPADLNRITQFDQNANRAVMAMQSVLKSGKESNLTALQQSLLELIAAYQDLVLHL
jgi:hypothetical protein